MSLRLTAPSEDILGANYKITKIVASDYNPNIDSTITVTVTVKDVYDDPVENESVQVTCNIGKFTKLNGSTISDTQSVTGNTDSNGQFTLTYTCSEWGLATFSAKNHNTQIRVAGFRKIVENATYSLYVDESTRTAQIEAHRTGITITSGQSFSNYGDFVIPTKYYPKSNCYSLIMRNATFLFWVWNNGSYGVTNLGNTVTGYDLTFIHEWHY